MSASAYYQRATGVRSARGRRGRAAARRGSARSTRPTTTPTATADVDGAAAGRVSRSGADRVKRLMRAHGIQGAKRRGKPWRTTTAGSRRARRRPDLVERDFSASGPDRLWVAPRGRLAVRHQHAHRPGARRAAMALSRRRPGADVERSTVSVSEYVGAGPLGWSDPHSDRRKRWIRSGREDAGACRPRRGLTRTYDRPFGICHSLDLSTMPGRSATSGMGAAHSPAETPARV